MGGGDDYPSLDKLTEETLLASQIIEKLRQAISEYGDLPVYIRDRTFFDIRIKGFRFENGKLIIDD